MKTVAHNYWTTAVGGHHGLNTKSNLLPLQIVSGNILGSIASLVQFKDRIDSDYFFSMYNMTDKLKKFLIQAILKSHRTAVLVGRHAKIKQNTSSALFYTGDEGLASRYVRKATRDFGKGMVTTATCFVQLEYKPGQNFIVYITFDGKDIYDIKVLCKKRDADPEDYDSYYVEKINEFDKVPKNWYQKG
jgi:hypothetical protein